MENVLYRNDTYHRGICSLFMGVLKKEKMGNEPNGEKKRGRERHFLEQRREDSDILRECILIEKRGAILDNKRNCELNSEREQKEVSGSVS